MFTYQSWYSIFSHNKLASTYQPQKPSTLHCFPRHSCAWRPLASWQFFLELNAPSVCSFTDFSVRFINFEKDDFIQIHNFISYLSQFHISKQLSHLDNHGLTLSFIITNKLRKSELSQLPTQITCNRKKPIRRTRTWNLRCNEKARGERGS